jgi:PAS domain S-box-containing protein
LGTFVLYFDRPSDATPRDHELAAVITHAAAIIISRYNEAAQRTRIQESLRRSEEKYRTLFETIDEGFAIVELIFDEAGKPVDYLFIETNPAFERHTGLKDAVGQTMRSLIPDHEQVWFDVYGRVALTGKPERFEGQAAALGYWYDVFAFPTGSPNQNHVAILFKDISERKRINEALRESNERMRLLIEGVTESAIFTMDQSGSIDSWNTGSERLYGFHEDEIIGQHFTVLFTDVDKRLGLPERELETALRTGRSVIERWHVREDGSTFFASGVIQPLGQNRDEGFVKIARDMTDRLRTEAARREKELLQTLLLLRSLRGPALLEICMTNWDSR